jgi:hypothetical protein
MLYHHFFRIICPPFSCMAAGWQWPDDILSPPLIYRPLPLNDNGFFNAKT